jgi:hypothetical protein
MPKEKKPKKYLVLGTATVRFEIEVEAENRADAEQAAHDIGAEELAQDHATDAVDTDVDEVRRVED